MSSGWAILVSLALVLSAASTTPEASPAPAAPPQAGSGFEATEPPAVGLVWPEDKQGPASPGEQTAPNTPSWWQNAKPALDQAVGQPPGATPTAVTTQTPAQTGKSYRYSVLRGIAALSVILALIYIAYAAVARFGKKSPLLAGASLGTLLGRVYLTPKACLYFVRVADKVLVVGVTPATVSSVAVLDGAGFEMPRSQAPSAGPASRPGFHAMLQSAKPPAPANVPESDDPEIAALRGEIARLRDELQESSREIGA